MGHMASHVAYRLQGKNLPSYKNNVVNHNQYCIIVNSDHTLVKDREKLRMKEYASHTGYPGGFKTIKLKNYLKENSPGLVFIWNKE